MPILLVLFAVTTAASAADRAQGRNSIPWNRDVKAAWKLALEHQRPLLLFVTTDGCVHCRRMKQTTFKDRGVVNDLRDRFIVVAVKAKQEPELLRRLKIKSVPTTVIILTNGDVIDSISGFQTPKQLRERLLSTYKQASHQGPPRTNR